MPFLIDGHNLIGRMGEPRLSDPEDERKLVELLRAYLMRVRKTGTVFFDQGQPGGPGLRSNSVLGIHFARPPRTADDLIRERLEREKNPRGLVVVSADHAVMSAARMAGARVEAPRAFAARLLAGPVAPQKKTQGQLSPAEVAAWEEEFKKRR